jgi:hypothetical protein
MNPDESVIIAWCDPGYVESRFAASIAEVCFRFPNIKGVMRTSSSLLSQSRTKLCQQFLDSNEDWMLFVDSDIEVLEASLRALLETADSVSHPLVVGWYYLPKSLTELDVALSYRDASSFDGNGVATVKSSGLGVTLIHKSVLQKFAINSVSMFMDFPFNNGWMGEDHYFFTKAIELGVTPHLQRGAKFPHIKKHVYI